MNYENEIKSCTEHFERLLREQIARARKMEDNAGAVDFAFKDKVVIGCAGGDGIGPRIVEGARKILGVLLREQIDAGSIELRDIEGLTIENRLEKGEPVPQDVLSAR